MMNILIWHSNMNEILYEINYANTITSPNEEHANLWESFKTLFYYAVKESIQFAL